MYLGIDLGTSSIKIVIMSTQGEIIDSASSNFEVLRPQPLWSEQNPDDWYTGMRACIKQLKNTNDLSKVVCIGLSGQMHGATLLDEHGKIIRPAILWNDGRCAEECEEIERAVPKARVITGNIIMPGFTAPKLLWLQKFEPDNFARINKILLPKDYLRFCLTGDYASDMSDAAGTCWLDVEKRDWDETMLAATGLTETQMPKLYEGSEITGVLSSDLAKEWGMAQVPVVAGAGDNAAGAIGLGIVSTGQAMLSLGTSGVYFAASDGFYANPESAVHSFCHALPNQWHLMSVMLSAASCLQWYADAIAKRSVASLLAELDLADVDRANACYFLPYLAGERTPHNNPEAKGAFLNLTAATTQAEMTHSVLEGVAFAFADCVSALHNSGLKPTDITLIGGGARSHYWRQMLADVLDLNLSFRKGGEVGPALGAARLAQLAIEEDKTLEQVCPVPPLEKMHKPNQVFHLIYVQRLGQFRKFYTALNS